MKTAKTATFHLTRASNLDRMRARAERILAQCRAGRRDKQSKEVLAAVATVGLTRAVEIFTGAPLNSPENAAKVVHLPLGRRLVRELNGAKRH